MEPSRALSKFRLIDCAKLTADGSLALGDARHMFYDDLDELNGYIRICKILNMKIPTDITESQLATVMYARTNLQSIIMLMISICRFHKDAHDVIEDIMTRLEPDQSWNDRTIYRLQGLVDSFQEDYHMDARFLPKPGYEMASEITTDIDKLSKFFRKSKGYRFVFYLGRTAYDTIVTPELPRLKFLFDQDAWFKDREDIVCVAPKEHLKLSQLIADERYGLMAF